MLSQITKYTEFMNKSLNNRKQSIWRPISAQKIIAAYDSNVILAPSETSELKISSIVSRINGERKNRFYRKSLNLALQDQGLPVSKIIFWITLGILSVILFSYIDYIPYFASRIWELVPAMNEVKTFLSKITLTNFMNTVGDFGVRIAGLK